MKKSELLKKVLALYEPGGMVDNHRCTYFICINIDNLGLKHASHKAAEELKAWIDFLLEGRTYGEWLDEFHPELTEWAHRSFRQGRYEWLQWMIWYWEDQGQ